MDSVAAQVGGWINIEVLHSPCAGPKLLRLKTPSAFSTRSGSSKLLHHVRPVQLGQIRKQWSGPRASTLDVAMSEKENEGPSYGFRDTNEQSDTQEKERSFNWLEQWYPVSIVKHMDKKQPYAETILGRDLVIWWDRNANRWQVFDDVCPHRLAPLSEGRIHESGHLQCSYHGWTFDSCGSCTWIPQLDQGREQAVNNKRACVKVYISIEHQGMVWVWMDRDQGAEQRAAANPPPFVPWLSDPSFVFDLGMTELNYGDQGAEQRAAANPPPFVPWLSDPSFVFDLGMTELNYGYEFLVENLLDPSHVPFAHHKLQGNRSSARPLSLKIVDSHIQGFEAKREEVLSLTFHAPTLARMDFQPGPPKPPRGHPLALQFRQWIIAKKKSKEDDVKKRISTLFYCVPVAPGKSKVIWAFPRNFGRIIYKLTPRWFAHYSHMAVIDSDHLLLHKLEHKLQELGGDTDKLYFTPALADTGVIEFRKWFRRFARSKVDYGEKSSAVIPPTPPRRILFDRHSAHVARCTICSGAVANFKKLETVLQILSLALVGLVATAALNSWRGLNRFSLPLVCLAVVSAVASKLLSQFIMKMYEYHDYNHALVD